MTNSVACTSCGHAIAIGDAQVGASVTCPNCRAICVVPISIAALPDEAAEDGWITARAPRHVPSPTAITDDIDGLPYDVAPRVVDSDPMASPRSQAAAPGGGLEEPGNEAAQHYESEAKPDGGAAADPPSIAVRDARPIRLEWEAVASLRTRLCVLVSYEIALLVLGASWFFGDDSSLREILVTSVLFSALAAYVLGTYERLNLSRNHQGRVVLSKTWRCCFIALGTKKIELKGYEAVATTANQERVVFDWLMLVWLLSLGLAPGILWWIFVFSKPNYQVALAKSHGQAATVLYQGTDEKRMNEIAQTVGEVCRYRWRRTY